MRVSRDFPLTRHSWKFAITGGDERVQVMALVCREEGFLKISSAVLYYFDDPTDIL